jgi:carboxylate-amine ligase
MKAPSLTLGLEEEYQIIDPETRELRSFITEILNDERVTIRELKPEMHQSIVEVGTQVCHNTSELRDELVRLRRIVIDTTAGSGLKVAAAGSHPFSSWLAQDITPLARYAGVREDLQQVAQQTLVFGMHVHIGIEDREFMIDAMNVVRYFLPHLLCLSTSSPFWMGRKTGLKSYRSVIWNNFPRTGIPRSFQSWSEYEQLVETMVHTGSMEEGSKIWWDLRPHWKFPTLEFRICDICTRVNEAICLASLFQAIVAKLWKLRRDNLTFRSYPIDLLEENKWRAVRYGIDGNLIDFGKEQEIPARELVRELVEWFVDDVVDELGSRKDVEYALTILDEGTSADRQLAVFDETGDLKAVVDHLIAETAEDVP